MPDKWNPLDTPDTPYADRAGQKRVVPSAERQRIIASRNRVVALVLVGLVVLFFTITLVKFKL